MTFAWKAIQPARNSQKLSTNFFKEIAKTSWVGVVGFALCQCWIALCFFAPQLFPESSSTGDYEMSLVATIVALLPGILFARKIEEIAHRKRIIYPIAACASLGTLLVSLSACNAAPLLPVKLLAAALIGIGSAWLFIAWYRVFYQIKDIAGCVLSVGVQALLLYVLTNILMPPAFSPWMMVVIAVIMPPASAVCLRKAQPMNDPASITYELKALTQDQAAAIARLCIGMFVISFVCEYMRNQYLTGSDLAYYSENINLAMLLLKLAVSVLIVSSVSRDLRHVPALYKISFILVAFSVLFLPYLNPLVGYSITNFGAFFFKIVVLLVAFTYCQRYKISPILIFSITRITWALDLLLAFRLYCSAQDLAIKLGFQPDIVTVTLGLVIFLTYLFVMTDHERITPVTSRKTQKADSSNDIHSKCATLAEAGKLSRRETEVLGLIARGRSAPRIQEELNLSINTVNSHISHIYRKLGVNSKQELLDLIEATATNDK